MTKQHAKARTPSHETGRVDPLVTGGDSAVFSSLIEPYRRELHVHCYRLLGSLQDAEDLVQETLLRAWQHFEAFKGYASLRTWLYTIATNACLDTLKKRQPRTLPAAASPPMNPLTPIAQSPAESIWRE
jgi:RNA polymerase sigma-70 factor (ECF subfamily)